MQKIVCAANRHKKTRIIILGIRHFDFFMRMEICARFGDAQSKNKYWEQGFVDQKGNFLNREEALIIARNAEQLERKTGGANSKELYSEDLY